VITISGEDFLTADEAATALAVKQATLYAYVSRGLLQSYRQGIRRRRLYRRAEVEEILTLRPSKRG
jgi:citrate synthase